MIWAAVIVYTTFLYLALGVLFAVWFVAFGVTKLDDSANGTTVGFRVLIFFGAVAFWVLLLKRLLKSETRPTEKNAHRRKSLEEL